MIQDDVLIRRAEVVRIHLDALDALMKEPSTGASEAIRASLSLRFLFDGALAQVAHAAGVPLLIPAPTLDGVPIDQALLFACGGYEVAGAHVRPHYCYREPGIRSPHRSQFERQISASPDTHPLSKVKLGRFGQLPCLTFVGKVLKREETVRYVANKCGGAHHSDDMAKFDEIDHHLTKVGHILRVGGDGLSSVFLETLGTAWFLLNAPAVVDLRTALRVPVEAVSTPVPHSS
jgi:hypothetical protein